MGACDGTNKAKVNSKQFFHVAKTINQNNTTFQNNNNLKLEFTIENCIPENRYQVIAQFLNENLEPFLTEIVKSHGNLIIFNSCYLCQYLFERAQMMKITVNKNGKSLGSFTTYLGMIVGSPNSILRTNIQMGNPENIIITAQGITNVNTSLMVNFIVKPNKNVNFKDINNKISYIITGNGRKVYSSESLSKQGQFKSSTIPVALIEPQFEISFFNCKQEKILTKSETINSFIEQNNRVYLTLNINKNDYYIYNRSQILQQYSFVDYLKNGVQLGLSIGIDFTSSNGQINEPNSLHSLVSGTYNDYEQAISSCGLILAFYDYDQLFPAYGFGAIINNNPKPNMCFNINFNDDPNIYTIDNVIKEYRNCLKKIIFAGPTEFCPMIRKEIETIRNENNPLIYHILMILTDGIIVDQQATMDAIIEASFLPFSLIIIGIGNDHFQEMIELDGDEAPLISSNGTKIMRDVVQFVRFNTYRNNPDELAAKVLEELPNQIVQYYTMINIFPNNLQNAQLRTKTMMNNNNIQNF